MLLFIWKLKYSSDIYAHQYDDRKKKLNNTSKKGKKIHNKASSVYYHMEIKHRSNHQLWMYFGEEQVNLANVNRFFFKQHHEHTIQNKFRIFFLVFRKIK